ncbi:alanine racemase [Cellulomonas fimi]|uniref:Alanine racemase n=1 Tax=Cellulomonas fimi (strain ATCC 484 / DSM 20113 / JCM 1341 / CCUG 24087 / LMG 16345 / NBRC 15513 / NCIMB 8980 / NCTC 7547 / NRS-133) TaxID=590998 RepID=F4H889_CELFA|nr:alanine racemase [Cellulomonas fimi]AEE44646.1 alanine racemase [Cellulomonas fimi ATCC 484]NNH08989.1 alanine racemase [Cellulomonas fimi]VEH26884.1 Alanine racemase [Cellulomonas fimi]
MTTTTLTRPRVSDAAGPRLLVDPAAVAANTRLLAGRARGDLMAVVKADGFGHGAVTVARTALAHGATSLGVTTVAEALALRDAGLRAPVLSWLNPVDADFASAVAAGVELAVPDAAHLRAVLDTAPGARVHLHLDTGLARDGAEPAAWPSLCRLARSAERTGRVRVVGVMGHLACADRPRHPANAEGRSRFAWGVRTARAAGLRPSVRHLAATAATLTDPRSHHTTVRVGAGLVGIDPSGTTRLAWAMSLTAPVVSVRRVRAGTPVGYGHTWTAPRATTLALLPVGYADGLPRAVPGRAEVLLRGRRRPVVGRVSMDQTVVDVGDEPVRPGEVAVLLGPGTGGEPTPEDWADWFDVLPHEVLTGFGPRVARGTVGTSLRDAG